MKKKLRHNNPICAFTDDVLSIGSAEKQCLKTGRVCDVVEIPQSRMATATSRPPARDIRDTVNPPRGFCQSAMLTSHRASKWAKFDSSPKAFCGSHPKVISRYVRMDLLQNIGSEITLHFTINNTFQMSYQYGLGKMFIMSLSASKAEPRKWSSFRTDHFQMHFLKWTLSYFD